MTAALIIVLREALEASLIVGIFLAYLNKTENKKHSRWVWYGVAGGIALSALLAAVFQRYLGGFEGAKEEIYEGVTMLLAGGLLTWMILWMIRQRKNLKKNLENKVATYIKKDHPIGIFFLVLVSVVREGIETVIFLQAALLQANSNDTFVGALIGLTIAIVLGYVLYKGILKFPLRKFFGFTSVLLILFAAGLIAHGLHEFQEAHLIPTYIEHVWDMNGVLNEKGTFGGIMKGLFGYNGNPSLIEVVSYLAYLVGIGLVWKKIDCGK